MSKKLTVVEVKQIKELHESGVSIRSLARQFSVARRLIQFALYPERKVRMLKGGKK